MALEATFRELTASLQKLNDVVNALHITLEDKPQHDEAAVADDLADKALELLGFVHEARQAAMKAWQAIKSPPDMDNTRRSLTLCQERFHKIEQDYSTNLVSYEKVKELVRVGGRGSEWAAWSSSTKQGIEQCRMPLEAANKAIAACWQELAERLGMMSISVKATNIGQHIAASSETVLVPEPDP
jgi:hypothetical protein